MTSLKTLRINFQGEGEVTAADIETDGSVEILNPDLHIATVSEGGHLTMEMTANRGRGYNNAEKNKTPDMPIGVITNRFYIYTCKESKLCSREY